MKEQFFVRKMKHTGSGLLEYTLCDIPLNALIGSNISLEFTGKIQCIHCDREIKKTFNQGYCYPCFQSLARCDMCILKPETCHYRKGTCREPEWAGENCLQDHVVYLANTTGLKVGITRGFQKHDRWGDQGAVAAIEFAIVPERYVAGLMEVEIKEHISDKTDWRKLITGFETDVDLIEARIELARHVPGELRQHLVDTEKFSELHELEYPVRAYPEKAKTWNFDKTPDISGTLEGIRGQYLFIDGKALNVRKYGGYQLSLSA